IGLWSGTAPGVSPILNFIGIAFGGGRVMPIPLSCRCGRSFQAPDQQVGGHAFCPSCGAKHFVPPPDSIVAEPPPPEQPKTQPKPQTKSQSATQSAAKSFRCTVCGGKFNASRVYDDNGEIICHDCYDAEEQGTSQDTGFYIKTWFFPLAWTMFFYTIDLRINDKRHNIGWYQTKFFPLPPGKYTVEMT